MPVFSGSTSASAVSTAYTIPARIKSFSIVNKSGSSATVNVSILYGSTNVNIIPYNSSIAAGAAYLSALSVSEILLIPGEQIYITTNQSIDYYFSIE